MKQGDRVKLKTAKAEDKPMTVRHIHNDDVECDLYEFVRQHDGKEKWVPARRIYQAGELAPA